MCKITWFINDHKCRVTNSILTALAIQASNSQNTLPRHNFHLLRKMPPGPSPFTRLLLWIADQFYFFIVIFIINFWHFLETFSYMYFQILGELHSLASKDPYFFHAPSSDLMHYCTLLLPAQLENNSINSYTCTIMIVSYYCTIYHFLLSSWASQKLKKCVVNIQAETISPKWKSYLPNSWVIVDLYSPDAFHTCIGEWVSANF